MNTEQKIDAVLILYPRVAREWVHFDWIIYVNGERRAVYSSSSSRMQREDSPLFPSFKCREAAQWLVSEDKKRFREKAAQQMAALWDQDITLEMIKRNAPCSNWYDRAQYTPSFDHWNITEFAVMPVRICPRTGLVWRYRTEVCPLSINLPPRKVFVLSILRRPLSGVVIGGCGVISVLKFAVGRGREWAGPTFLSGDRFNQIKAGLGITTCDPRAFLYEKKERLSKSQIVTFVRRRIRKISRMRPVSKSERFFFQSMIGAKRLMDFLAA